MSGFVVKKVATKAFQGQKPGTSGLRKKVTVFQEPHYLANFVQASFNSLPQDGLKGSTLVLGGDGRYFNKEALQIIIKMAAANGVGGLLVGHNGILSTPAVSGLIRGRKAFGAFILTASHNPGGPTADFGIKYNMSNGGPAPESVTNAIYEQTTKLTEYLISDLPDVDLNVVGKHTYGSFTVEIIDSADDYLALMKTIFDFEALKNLIARPDFKMIFDSLSGVTGAYTERIFVKELGASIGALQNYHPSEDFNGHHPDPNLTYAHELVEKMYSGDYDFGAASDGDGDRNMVLGKKFFVNPSDSIAVIAANSSAIPYFKSGLKGLARSMPTSGALDRVARALGFECYEVPTGWKFFGNLMDAGKCSLCGEESFGTGSDHIREKDGVWAVLAWLSIVAARNTDPKQPLVTVEDIVSEHWARFGRNYFSRYDFEEVTTAQGDAVINHLNDHLKNKLVGRVLKDPSSGKEFTVATADNFEYKDPIDHSVSSNQGLRIIFTDGSRLIYRLSGTGSSGATIRVYYDMYDAKNVKHETQEALRPLINVGMELAQIEKLAGRKTPTVIT